MAKWIKETFPLEMPDYYLSQERTKGYVEDWTYEGPRRVAVYIYKDTNLLAWNHSYQQLSDKNDPDLQKQQWEDLEIHAGLDKYPVELTFEKDPVLISAMVQLEVLQEDIPLQKEYYWDGREEIHPTDKKWYNEEDKIYKYEKERDWMYAHSWPILPGNLIELWDIKYDPEKKEFVKPYGWKKPTITTHEFLYYYYHLIDEMKRYIEEEGVDWMPDKIKIFDDYLEELVSLQDKFEPFLDRPWMIALPNDPRYKEENFKKVDTFPIMDESGFGQLIVTQENLMEMADKVQMNPPQGFSIDP
jgi:hypothetical protein